MCWKQEWASAYNNLGWAIIHAGRAQTKLERRAQNTMRRKLTPDEVTMAQVGLERNETFIRVLRRQQEELKWLIEHVGLWVKDDPERTRRLMEGQRGKKGRPWEPVDLKAPQKLRGEPVVADQTFINAWNEHATVHGVADSVGLSYDTVLKYRKRLDLPKKRNP